MRRHTVVSEVINRQFPPKGTESSSSLASDAPEAARQTSCTQRPTHDLGTDVDIPVSRAVGSVLHCRLPIWRRAHMLAGCMVSVEERPCGTATMPRSLRPLPVKSSPCSKREDRYALWMSGLDPGRSAARDTFRRRLIGLEPLSYCAVDTWRCQRSWQPSGGTPQAGRAAFLSRLLSTRFVRANAR